MSGRIPDRIRHKFYIHYLRGDSVTRICEQIGISRSSCYNLLFDFKKLEPNIELMRALAVNLRRNGSDVPSYAVSLKIHNLLEQHDISQNVGEKLIEEVVDGRYRENWNPYKAVRAFKEFSESSAEFGHTLREHSDYFRKLRVQKVSQKNVIKDLQKITDNLVKKHSIIKENLKVFQEIDGVKNAEFRNWREEYEYKRKNRDLKRQTYLNNKGLTIDPTEVKKLNNSLVTQLTSEQIDEKIEWIRMHPSLFPELFFESLSTATKPIDREIHLQPEKEPLGEKLHTTIEKEPKSFVVNENFQ